MDKMDIMYRVIKVMGNRGYPIVFKGAMLLKHIMYTNQLESTTRITQDIDEDWIDNNISMNKLSDYVSSSIQSIGIPGLEIDCTREASAGKAAGYKVSFYGEKLFLLIYQ